MSNTSSLILPSTGLSRAKDLLPFVGIGLSTLWKWSNEDKFPKPIKLSPTITAWKNEDVWVWLKEKGLSGVIYEQPITQTNESKDDLDFKNSRDLYKFIEQSRLRLASKTEILDNAIGFSKVSGIYFLIKSKEIVYIGQSLHCPKRICEHTDKDFDDFAIIGCDKDSLDIMESLYILKFEPKLNGTFTGLVNNNAKFTPLKVHEIIEYCKKSSEVQDDSTLHH